VYCLEGGHARAPAATFTQPLPPDPSQDSAGKQSNKDATNTDKDLGFVILQPSKDSHSMRMTQVDNAVGTKEVVHNDSCQGNSRQDMS
jgi:hypothetical protein